MASANYTKQTKETVKLQMMWRDLNYEGQDIWRYSYHDSDIGVTTSFHITKKPDCWVVENHYMMPCSIGYIENHNILSFPLDTDATENATLGISIILERLSENAAKWIRETLELQNGR